MPVLLLKLTLTPILIGASSLVARRWGPVVGGWIVSLPLTSGPVLFFLAVENGPAFAASTSVGTLLGLGAIAAYCVGFTALVRRGPAAAFAGASVAYVLTGLLAQLLAGWPFAVLAVLVGLAIALVLTRLPASSAAPSTTPHPAWDLPARMVVGTALVFTLTTLAPLLGPVDSGIATTFPVYVSVLSIFAYHHDGAAAALGVLRGLLVGLFGTIAFYAVVHFFVVSAGVGPAFLAAVVVTCAVSALALLRVRASAASPVDLEPA